MSDIDAALLDALPEITLVVTRGGRIEAANAAAVERLGLSADELARRSLWQLVTDPEAEVLTYLRACARSRQRVLGALTLAADEETRFRVEGALLRPRGGDAEARVLLRLMPKEESIGRFLELNRRIELLDREVVRRRRLEGELRAQREWLAVTLASIGDAVITTDLGGRVTFLNPRAEALTGWAASEALGRPLEEVFPIINEQTRERVDNPVAKVLERGETVGLANHTVLVARDGAENAIEDTAAPIREPGGALLGVVLVFHDVGDRRLLERQLRDRAEELALADRRKDEFLSMLAHELRNPLSPIRNGLHILRRSPGSSPLMHKTHEMLDRQVTHMVRMIDDLLDVSRITRGKIALDLQAVDLAELARLTCSDHASELVGRSVTLQLPLEPVWVHADPTRLTQVLGNLLDNAIKFSEPGGPLLVRVGLTPGGEVELVVQDTGVGIEPGLLPHLFEPFSQADRTIERSRGGLGLGLAMAKGLVELQGGRIEAASDGPGTGARLTVFLPRGQAPARRPGGVDPAGPVPSGLRVLVVDDNRDQAESLRMVLELSGYQAVLAFDGHQALALARQTRPDVVFCDIGLPGMDGFAVAAALRADPETAQARLFAVTGYGEESMRTRALQAGFDAHLVKPVEPGALLALLSPSRP